MKTQNTLGAKCSMYSNCTLCIGREELLGLSQPKTNIVNKIGCIRMVVRIGRYGIALGRAFWIQTHAPVNVWHFLCFWVFKETRASDIDKRQNYPLGTCLVQDGRRYYYYKAGKDIICGNLIEEDKNDRHK